jgi:hypothetical protein
MVAFRHRATASGALPGRARRPWRWVALAGAVAASTSGAPSTVHALVTGGDPLRATRAAATLVPGRRPDVTTGVAVHVAVSAGWTMALAAIDRRHRLGVRGGAVAGLLIALLDLEVIGRGHPEIAALPRLPQWLDHVAFGAVVGGVLGAAPGQRHHGSRRR